MKEYGLKCEFEIRFDHKEEKCIYISKVYLPNINELDEQECHRYGYLEECLKNIDHDKEMVENLDVEKIEFEEIQIGYFDVDIEEIQTWTDYGYEYDAEIYLKCNSYRKKKKLEYLIDKVKGFFDRIANEIYLAKSRRWHRMIDRRFKK